MSGQLALDLAGVLTAEHATSFAIPARRGDETGTLVLLRFGRTWSARSLLGPKNPTLGRDCYITQRNGWTLTGKVGCWPTAEEALAAAIAAGVEVLP